MRHCLIMTAYKDVDNINQFISVIPESWGVYIHLDKKSNISITDIKSKRVNVIKEKKIYWGGHNHLAVIVEMLSRAIKDSHGYDYFHICTGQDFLASKPKDFDSLIGWERNIFMEIFPLPKKNWWGNGCEIYQLRTISDWGDIRFGIWHYIHNLCRKIFSVQKYLHLERKLPEFPLYGGSVYCSLTREFVEWMFMSKKAMDYLYNLRYTWVSEEIFFQTVVMFSPFRDKVKNNNLRYISWGKYSPRYLDVPDIDEVTSGKYILCRKVNSHNTVFLNNLLHNVRKQPNLTCCP